MFKQKRKFWFILGQIMILLTILSVGLMLYLNFTFLKLLILPVVDSKSSEYSVIKTDWAKNIDTFGPYYAYKKLLLSYDNRDPRMQHLAAHAFGEDLYEKNGVSGFEICDNSFNAGCFHGFFSRAVLNQGESVINNLNDFCLKKYGDTNTFCQHGIGHGLAEFYGFTGVNKALERCLPLQKYKLLGCSSGIFMDYNLFSNNTLQQRKLENNPYSPCESVNSKFQHSCYYEQAQLWGESQYDFAQIITLCKQAPVFFQSDCITGAGVAAGSMTNFQSSDAISLCSGFENQIDKDTCLQGLYWSFLTRLGKEDDAPKVCSEASQKETCLFNGDLRNHSF